MARREAALNAVRCDARPLTAPSRRITGPAAMFKRLAAASLFLALSCLGASASTCYVTELYLLADAGVQVAKMPPIKDSGPVTVSAASSAYGPTTGDTRMVRIECDVVVSIAFGTNGGSAPTATTGNMRMAASAPEYFKVDRSSYIAFITNN